jgi:hypothetical protein
MKKIFIGLLIIAAGAGAYYFLQTKKPITENKIQKELLVGKWKMDTLSVHSRDSSMSLAIALAGALDSNFYANHYDFRADGHILQSRQDSATADTSYYEWNTKDELLIKESAIDSTAETFTISALNNDSLIMLSNDSSRLVFTRLK